MTSGREVERQIQAAIAEGSFDDLAGNGKPQDLTENSLEDPAQRMAFHVLKLGDVTPDWVQLGNEIERADDVKVRVKINRSGTAAIEALIVDGEVWRP